MAGIMEDSVETYLGSAALFEFTFLDPPECWVSGYPERWGMTSLLGADFGATDSVCAIPDDEEFDAKTMFDDDDDDDDDDDIDDDEEDDDAYEDEDDEEDEDDLDDDDF